MALEKKKLFTYVEVDDNTPIQKLSVKDQLRVLIQRLTYDDASELKTEDAVTVNQLTLQANLMEFIHRATEPIRRGEKHKVTVMISNMFDPVLQQVLESHVISNYYAVEVQRPDIEYDVKYFITVKLEVKTT